MSTIELKDILKEKQDILFEYIESYFNAEISKDKFISFLDIFDKWSSHEVRIRNKINNKNELTSMDI